MRTASQGDDMRGKKEEEGEEVPGVEGGGAGLEGGGGAPVLAVPNLT